MKALLALLMIIIALAAWAGYGGFFWLLGEERAAYTVALEDSEREALRGESAARTHAAVAGTERERAALENLLNITILQAVEAIEQAGDAAGASNMTIGAATPTEAPKNLTAVSIVANATGSFATLMRAVQLLETLPIPAALEQFELIQSEGGKNVWNLTAHVRILMSAN